MLEIGAFEAKNKLGALLDRVQHGEEIIITRHGKPVARLVPNFGRIDRSQAHAAAERIRTQSIRIVREELERGTSLGARYVMFHSGSGKEVGETKALEYAMDGIKKIYDGYEGTTQLLIEISAGAGMVIGNTFEELATLLEGVDHPDLGICFDTAHAFASGYDLRTKEAVDRTFRRFDEMMASTD